MTPRRKRLLVVDASVARAAGETEHPVSSSCRRCLLTIRDVCHRVAIAEATLREWDRHSSRFSRKWRRSMAARRKPIEVIHGAAVRLDLRAFRDPERSAIEKDLPLLQAALSTDGVIVTGDEALRNALASAPAGAAYLRRLKWINPVIDGPEVLEDL